VLINIDVETSLRGCLKVLSSQGWTIYRFDIDEKNLISADLAEPFSESSSKYA